MRTRLYTSSVMAKPRLIIVGGFLGSGKTTLIMNLGKRLSLDMKKRVAVITNDQGEVLVDTKVMEASGFPYAEVVNGCFCCRFPDFVAKMREILSKVRPEVILAEPVGSCTDILATVYTPLSQYYGGVVELSPYLVLVDSSTMLNYDRMFNITSPRGPMGFLISWQIKEAEVIGLNKVDLVSSEVIAKVEDIVKKVNDKAEVIQISAKTGYNVDKLLEILLNRDHRPRPGIDVDYDVYSKAEEELGWLNASCKVVFKAPVKTESYVRDLMNEVAKQINAKKGLVVHEKMLFITKSGIARASYVVDDGSIDLVGKFPEELSEVDVVINVRAKSAPEDIDESVRKAIDIVNRLFDGELRDWYSRSFKPPPPKPWYRRPP